MSLQPASTLWFARHELVLAWREWMAMISGGRTGHAVWLLAGLATFGFVMHLAAGGLIQPWVEAGVFPDKQTMVLITGIGLLFWSVMLSQAMESVTRAYYSRSDLDLILSSPASSQKLFAVRTGAIALTTIALACLLASPIIDMLAFHDGLHWLSAYGVLAALGALSATIALLVTIALFRLVGPKRTRLISQIIAAIVGAGFVIGIQAAAILSYGHLSRFEIFQSADVVAMAPALDSWLWLPARAMLGDWLALIAVLIIGFGSLAIVIVLTASSFGRHAIAAASVGFQRHTQKTGRVDFRPVSQKQALRIKEWKLLARDPWLLSQTLMQILYLLPPALLLWVNYGDSAGGMVVVVPVLVMAAGQLAGGLAWLAISGEDAFDLVITAPLAPRTILTAKIEAVLLVIAVVLAPLLLLLALSSPQAALITAIMAALSAGSATAIQLWFRVQSKRSMFRRRQTASRVATISEAFASILWAGTGALLAAGTILAVAPAFLAVLTLFIAWIISPKRR